MSDHEAAARDASAVFAVIGRVWLDVSDLSWCVNCASLGEDLDGVEDAFGEGGAALWSLLCEVVRVHGVDEENVGGPGGVDD